MATEIKAPTFPESVADGTVATWHKKVGEACSRDELLVDIETDKVVLEVVAPADGVLKEIVAAEGDVVESEAIIGVFEEGAAASAAPAAETAPAAEAAVPAASQVAEGDAILSPAARRIADEHGLDPSAIKGTGKGGRVTKEDALAHAKQAGQSAPAAAPQPAAAQAPVASGGPREEKRVPMSRLRARVAERLVQAQQTAAMLTTFNEVNMKPIMDLRNKYKDVFEKSHNGTRLGFMSFFVKAAVEALKRYPAVNASIDGNDIVYHGYQDVGVAVSSDRGLVVPVLRNAENMGLAEVEAKIREYGLKARDGKLSIDEMTGGTFTISNGGVFGSLISTPILNPPQTAILGMHKIQERPMAVNGKVEILPMMYLALSYDHRLLDGKEAVTFLVAIKEMLEDPARILLEI
ncbi:2-oxoglutarate dehydrogenase complex dihydrolipoyllysine-residue succinyltransferase [Spartinivicinus poritis]|uniref:Dihydrolipoyllysine-residue succinyltransferase component of 2-oxoglutarate dehydrogenase complex n=1 Tax=Spartinivicinus poritis TaxID=2994640 RepID=A0ABT5U486_9GAMM|nr:2-oxoglutarate dehydrogenase complex dihydrolipoyllysine-residue succinyltransferase [Spartinivicinus sp. A2-2]MDE1461180.1 2-oxoglutarate dehydrogenase complex dihydrolipoyllysine-residue succinyltransferase [Spartinivicinus sp. A2-2]